ncbi:MAG: NAD(+)/NADH kinase [Candidatus Bathyarchaeia archaeon]
MGKTAGIVARLDREDSLKLALEISSLLEKAGFNVFFEQELAVLANKLEKAVPLEKMSADVIIVIGGDGTILRTCMRIPKPETPVLAIGLGTRAFLTEVSYKEALEAINSYLKGSYRIETFNKIASFVKNVRLPDALNEVFITTKHLSKILHARIWKDNTEVVECWADGIIVSSQVGSTAYSFSSGGPILDPGLNALILTPVCPANLIRPIVFPEYSKITVEVLKPKRAMVVIDGDYQREIGDSANRVLVRISEHKVNFIRFKYDFYRRLRERLLFPMERENEQRT